MKNSRWLALIAAVALLIVSLAGCSSVTSLDTSKGRTVIDMAGREVTLNAPIKRVVALAAADVEIISALGAQDLLVGRGEYCDYPDSVLSIEAVQSGSQTNVEQIIALHPDVVIMCDMDQTPEQIEAIEAASIPVVETTADDIDGTYRAIELIGQTIGKEKEAAALIDGMKEEFSSITAKATENKTIYFEVSPLEYGLWTAGSGTFMDELAKMLGLKNAFGDVEGWAEISEEQVIERDPDYIVTITMYYGEGPSPEEEILSRKGWQDITAIKNHAIYAADSNTVSRPGPRLVDAAKALNEFINTK